jgi:glutathione S-transferase
MQPKIALYIAPPSRNTVRGTFVLLEKELESKKVSIDLFTEEHQKPPFSELTPRDQVPTLVFGSVIFGKQSGEDLGDRDARV